MNPTRLGVAAVFLLSGLTGCSGSSRVLRPGPAPTLIAQKEPPRPSPAPQRPAPAPVNVAPAWVPSTTGAPGWIPPKGVKRGLWQYVVIHHSATAAGGAAAFDRHHRNINHWDELGYHFVIGNGTDTSDGLVEVGSRWTKQKHGAHCKVPGNFYNEHGIGICLVGNFQERGPSSAQLASLTRLVGFLMSQCNIGVGQVVGHGGVTGKTACPGKLFPLAQLKSNLGRYATASSFR